MILAVSVALLAAQAVQAQDVPTAPERGDAQSALEARVAQFNPCDPLGAEIAGFSLGVGQVGDVVIRRSDIRLRGDGIEFDLEGRLTCTAGPGSDAEDISADVLVALSGILSTCNIESSEVNLTNVTGQMSWALDLATPVVEGILTERVEDAARRACTALAE